MRAKRKRKIEVAERKDAYITKTPKAVADICTQCPYPTDICGADGCDYYKERKAQLGYGRKRKNKSRCIT